jgi:signal transduction histidine kinase
MAESYAASYPQVRFEHQASKRPIFVDIAAELIIQALDKLVSNALDFHRRQTPILLVLEQPSAGVCELQVRNQGPELPDSIQSRLFDSMVSLRERSSEEPHLGLGLYLVRLITEYHRGKVSARNIEGGVCFCIRLPLNPAQ